MREPRVGVILIQYSSIGGRTRAAAGRVSTAKGESSFIGVLAKEVRPIGIKVTIIDGRVSHRLRRLFDDDPRGRPEYIPRSAQ